MITTIDEKMLGLTRNGVSRPFQISDVLDESFFSRYWGNEAVYFPGTTDRFAEIFGWREFNQVLQNTHKSSISSPFLAMVQEGKSVPVDAYTDVVADRKMGPFRQVSSEKLTQLCANGATLIINGIERFWVPLNVLTRELFATVAERVQANAYYSHKAVQGFNVHYDTHEVFVLQISGSKLWRLGPISYPDPLNTQPSSAQQPPEVDFDELTLRQGDVLYVPRGLWHCAIATSEPSLHITIGVHCRTRLDFAMWLIRSLADAEELRQNLHHPFLNTDLDKLKATLMDALSRRLTDVTILDRFEDATASLREGKTVTFDFPQSATPMPSPTQQS